MTDLMKIILIATTVFYFTEAAKTSQKIFNEVGAHQRPKIHSPFRNISNKHGLNIEKMCPAVCLYEEKCLSYVIDKTALQCLLYNVTIHQFMELVRAPNNFFYSIYNYIFRDCLDLYTSGGIRKSGVYQITLSNGVKTSVSCNMQVAGGGWLVLQRRMDGSQDFYKTWNEYKQGFGSVNGEFWWGNDKIHQLTSAFDHEFYVTAEQFDNAGSTYAHHASFRLLDEASEYTLHIGNEMGGGTRGLNIWNGSKFSTWDNDNDYWGNGNVAKKFQRSGLWYPSNTVSFNGRYHHQAECPTKYDGITWSVYKGSSTCLKTVEMLIRRKV